MPCSSLAAFTAGRTHQLRRHAAMIGHPILGDKRYHQGWAAEKQRLAQLDALSDGSDANLQEEQQQVGNGIVASVREAASDGSERDLKGEQAAADDMDERNAAESADGQCHGGSALADANGNSTAAAGPAADGHLCLWAVQIQLHHPVTLEELDVCIPEPDAYAALRAVHTASTAD